MKWEGLNEDDHDQIIMGLLERGVLVAQKGIVFAKFSC